jgi:phenylacetate-CoA ligase
VKYAYSVSAYREKYKKHGVQLNDIRSLEDINKLPVMTKSDIMDFYPEGIVPNGFNKNHSYLKSTSGSTGTSVSVYCDLFSAVKSLIGFARMLKIYGGSWYKTKVALVVDLTSGTEENVVFIEGGSPFIEKIFLLDNIAYIHKYQRVENIINQLNKFKPEYLGSSPNMLRKFALLKNKGHGIESKPKYIFSSCEILDSHTRKIIEDAFDTRVFDFYGATETGPIAFQCATEEHYHVHSDFVFLEFLDNDGKHIDYGKKGTILVTKLYGGGTPIIRYNGLGDIAVPIEENCSSGITTQMIQKIEKLV